MSDWEAWLCFMQQIVVASICLDAIYDTALSSLWCFKVTLKVKVKEVYGCLWKSIAQLQSVNCHMGSHSVTCHPTQVSTPHLNRWYLIYLPRRDGRLSWPRWLVTFRDGLPAWRRSPIQVLTGPVSINYVDWSHCANHCTTPPPIGSQ